MISDLVCTRCKGKRFLPNVSGHPQTCIRCDGTGRELIELDSLDVVLEEQSERVVDPRAEADGGPQFTLHEAPTHVPCPRCKSCRLCGATGMVVKTAIHAFAHPPKKTT